MKLFPLLFLTLTGVYNAENISAVPELSRDAMVRLEQGEILTYQLQESRKGQTFEAHALFSSSMQRTVAVITDFTRYPQFMPNVERIDIVEQSGNYTIINYYLGLPLNEKKRYRLLLIKQEYGDAMIIQWRMLEWPGVPEDQRIGNTTGFWYLKAYNNNQTLVRYHVYTDPGEVPFGLEWIIDYMSESNIPKVLQNSREYASKQ